MTLSRVVIASAAKQHVIASAAKQHVIASAAKQHVIASAAKQSDASRSQRIQNEIRLLRSHRTLPRNDTISRWRKDRSFAMTEWMSLRAQRSNMSLRAQRSNLTPADLNAFKTRSDCFGRIERSLAMTSSRVVIASAAQQPDASRSQHIQNEIRLLRSHRALPRNDTISRWRKDRSFAMTEWMSLRAQRSNLTPVDLNAF